MNILPHNQLRTYLLDRLRSEYLSEKPFPHLTELIYCLTRSWFDRIDSLPPTEDELLRFSIGFGLERVLISGLEPEKYIVDGIHLTPDFLPDYGSGGIHGELKSTRMWPPKAGETARIPDTWLEQTMGYCKATGTTEYDVAVVYLGAPKLEGFRLQFEPEEIAANWENILERKGIYLGYVTSATMPTPFKFNKEWECKWCRYSLRCNVWAAENRNEQAG